MSIHRDVSGSTRDDARGAIAASALEMTYASQDGGVVPALGPISLAVGEREFVSVVGPSGCGKSTLLKILAGLVAPSAGIATLGGAPVAGPSGRVGIVFQQPVLLPWKTVLENVLLPIQIRRQPVAQFRERATALLASVGLADFAHRYPHELSGGMQQRAAIVRALIADPPILMLDEPFGALDAITRDQMNVELLSVWARSPKTVLFITHGISEAVFLSDRVLVLGPRPGRLIAQYEIDLPRPRDPGQMAWPRFGETVATIRLALERATTATTAATHGSPHTEAAARCPAHVS